jgi:hypothetical protein
MVCEMNPRRWRLDNMGVRSSILVYKKQSYKDSFPTGFLITIYYSIHYLEPILVFGSLESLEPSCEPSEPRSGRPRAFWGSWWYMNRGSIGAGSPWNMWNMLWLSSRFAGSSIGCIWPSSVVKSITPAAGCIRTFLLDNRNRTQKWDESKTKVIDTDGGFDCRICLDSLQNIRKKSIDIMASPCGHVFCSSCITSSLQLRSTCPICQSFILPGQLIKLFLWVNEIQLTICLWLLHLWFIGNYS